jgi:hypothetical protein
LISKSWKVTETGETDCPVYTTQVGGAVTDVVGGGEGGGVGEGKGEGSRVGAGVVEFDVQLVIGS